MAHRMGALRGLWAGDRRPRRAIVLVLLLLAGAGRALPQGLSEYEIKAGFLFNFTRFVEWPDAAFRAPAAPFTVCVLGSAPIAALLSDAVAGKAVNGHAMAVKAMKPADDLRGCHVVFVGAGEQRHAAHIVEAARGAGALTVGESQGFMQAGGMVNFVIQDNKVKLELNLNAATAANLKVSAKLIAVSHLVQGKD